jgi:glycosyltransferase involved in cell wall biosynthesis
MTPPCVSIVIPVYNRAHTLERALQSVLSQTYQHFEVLVVDDASTDGGVASWAVQDTRVHLIKHLVNQGAAGARNTGVASAQGPLVAFLDSDDAWHPTKLEKQVALWAQSPDMSACVTWFNLCDGKKIDSCKVYPQDDWSHYFLKGCLVGPGSTFMAKKEVFEKVGPFPTHLKRFEDWEWFLRFAKHYTLGVVPETLVDVYKGPAADHKVTLASLTQLENQLTDLSPSQNRLFQGALAYERAAAYVRAGKKARALVPLLRSFLASPTFMGRILKKYFW